MTKLIFDAQIDDYVFYDPNERRQLAHKTEKSQLPKRTLKAARALVTEREDLRPSEGLNFQPSLNATKEERAWIVENLVPFYDGRVITDVLRRVKGGKEANVYCCRANPAAGVPLVAAKIYRPRQFRNLKNDSQYRQGRPVLDASGAAISYRDWRTHKAIASKSAFGLATQQTSWLEYEYQTLALLHAAGAAVPRPLKHGAHALLMEYLGDEVQPAPTLIDVKLDPREAPDLFQTVIESLTLFIQQGFVHGDLSAYNILYWEGEVKIIDFPQVVFIASNPDARSIFERDVTRVCDYFARYGIRRDPRRLARALWEQYGPQLIVEDLADL